jgi:alkyl hydroperoxide reductase subunit AhpC
LEPEYQALTPLQAESARTALKGQFSWVDPGKNPSASLKPSFAVAADPDQSIMKAYDAVLSAKPQLANRTSYVITPDARILYTYTNLQPDQHVANTLAALKAWKATH